MKFDFCIGNPPYQEEAESQSKTNNQKPRKNIFHYFQIQADKIAEEGSVMIYPGGRWIQQSGKGLKEFGHNQINDKTLSSVVLYADSKEVFGSAADLADGVSIVVKNKKKTNEGFNYKYINHNEIAETQLDFPGDGIIPLDPRDKIISDKIISGVKKHDLSLLNNRILPRSLFSIESDFVENNPSKAELYNESSSYDWNKVVKVLTNDKAGKAGRAKWFVIDKSEIKTGIQFLDKWKVIVSSANAGGQKRDNQLEIADNHSAFGRARVALGSFETKSEAENFYKYAKSTVIKYAFLLTDEALTSLGKAVPDICDYSDKNELLDFSKDIDMQLCEILSLTDQDFSYITKRVDAVWGNRQKEMA